MNSISADHSFKLLILGDTCVGKTCLMLRYTENLFAENHLSTIGVDYKMKHIELDDQLINIQIWDTAGQDRFRAITKNYLRGSDGIILVYDITNEQTFKNIKNWVNQIMESLGDKISIALVGNKIDMDLERKILSEHGEKIAKQHNFLFFETSAKENIGIEECFTGIVSDILGKCKGRKRNLDSISIKRGRKGTKKNKSCNC